MPRIPVLDEAAMQTAELQIPQLAHRAGLEAHRRAVNSQAATLVMKTASGVLVARQASGQETVLKALPAATPVRAGTVLKRVTPRASKAEVC